MMSERKESRISFSRRRKDGYKRNTSHEVGVLEIGG